MSKPLPIEVVPYDPNWPDLFAQEQERILAQIGGYVECIEHIGSTAVPGLAAKPVIDILIGVFRLSEAPFFLPPLTSIGYEYIPQHEVVFPERRYLHCITGHQHTHHLHMVEPDSEFFKKQLLFRDYLRTHPDDARQYGKLKFELALKFRDDRESYTNAKSAFIQKILLSAASE